MRLYSAMYLMVAFLVSGVSHADPVVNMRFEKQTQTMWCWAATATSTINHMRRLANNSTNVSQCKIVTHYNEVSSEYTYCCKSENAGGNRCNQPGSVYKPLNSHGYLKEQLTGQLTDARFQLLIEQLNKNMPVPAAVRWTGQNVGHAILVYGLGFPGFAGGQAIYIFDPTTGRQAAMQDRNELNNYGANLNGSWKAMYLLKR